MRFSLQLLPNILHFAIRLPPIWAAEFHTTNLGPAIKNNDRKEKRNYFFFFEIVNIDIEVKDK